VRPEDETEDDERTINVDRTERQGMPSAAGGSGHRPTPSPAPARWGDSAVGAVNGDGARRSVGGRTVQHGREGAGRRDHAGTKSEADTRKRVLSPSEALPVHGSKNEDSVPIPVNLSLQRGKGHKRSKYEPPWGDSLPP